MPGQARQILAQKLRTLRFIKGWSQEDLAEASGLHRTYISAIECGRSNISLDNVEKLANAFNITLHVLLQRPEAGAVSERVLTDLMKVADGGQTKQ